MPAPVPDRAVLLAPLSRDEILAGRRTLTRAGGAGFYAAWALARLGVRVMLHTPLAPEDQDLLAALPPGVEVVTHPSRSTTRFRIEIDPARPNERLLRLLAASDPIDPNRIEPLEGMSMRMLGPLLPGDLDGPLLERLRRAPEPWDLGAQGLVRRIEPDGRVKVAAPDTAPRLPPLRVLAADRREWAVLPESVVRLARERIVTLGDRGASIQLSCGSVPIEVPPAALRGPAGEAVGLGDTFLAVYAWSRARGADPREAGRRAAAAAAALLEHGLPRAGQ